MADAEKCGRLTNKPAGPDLRIAAVQGLFVEGSSSPGAGGADGTRSKKAVKPSPVAEPARRFRKSAAVSITPTFWATADAIH
ncbi:hypothetical protein ACG873_15405 [Mesorhizobium sp. AaZ16]|uniref:hypothetical protein n=1 Tax=Mesorhizobium sp. AaZ16 TaxID=3402289 RepID=UPI00374F89C0